MNKSLNNNNTPGKLLIIIKYNNIYTSLQKNNKKQQTHSTILISLKKKYFNAYIIEKKYLNAYRTLKKKFTQSQILNLFILIQNRNILHLLCKPQKLFCYHKKKLTKKSVLSNKNHNKKSIIFQHLKITQQPCFIIAISQFSKDCFISNENITINTTCACIFSRKQIYNKSAFLLPW